MIFITGPLYSGKRTFAKTLPGRCICDVQELAAGAENLEKLADEQPPGGWPVCWPHGQTALCRYSAASPPF